MSRMMSNPGRLELRIEQELLEALDRIAERRDMNRSELVRKILQKEVMTASKIKKEAVA